MRRPRSLKRRKFRVQLRRGQAMVEYSVVNVFALMGLALAVNSRVFGNNKNLIDLFLEAYQMYYDSFYFVLNLPIP